MTKQIIAIVFLNDIVKLIVIIQESLLSEIESLTSCILRIKVSLSHSCVFISILLFRNFVIIQLFIYKLIKNLSHLFQVVFIDTQHLKFL